MHLLLFTKQVAYVFQNIFQEANQRSTRGKSADRKTLVLWPKSLMYYADRLDPMGCIMSDF